jgi:hypothetical protein
MSNQISQRIAHGQPVLFARVATVGDPSLITSALCNVKRAISTSGVLKVPSPDAANVTQCVPTFRAATAELAAGFDLVLMTAAQSLAAGPGVYCFNDAYGIGGVPVDIEDEAIFFEILPSTTMSVTP